MTLKGEVLGRVQGVWFRRHVQAAAQRAGVTGYAKNLPDGAVEVLLCGDDAAVEEVRQAVEAGPPDARVDSVRWQEPVAVSVPEDFKTL